MTKPIIGAQHQFHDPDFVADDGTALEVPKVLTWDQTPEELAAESWYNPMDVAKGHRGFMDGGFIMVMYAWSPNWMANTVGHDNYNLYIRRSFDGGQTWTTLPADYTHWSDLNPDITIDADGTTTCEWYGGYTEEDYSVCTFYGAGEFEQAAEHHVVEAVAGLHHAGVKREVPLVDVLTPRRVVAHETVEEVFDLVVLSVGITPGEDIGILSRMLKTGPDEFGFFETGNKGISIPKNGVFTAGTVQGPMSIPETIAGAGSAVWRIKKYIDGLIIDD